MEDVLNQQLIQDAEESARGFMHKAIVAQPASPPKFLPLMEDRLSARPFFLCVVWWPGVI